MRLFFYLFAFFYVSLLLLAAADPQVRHSSADMPQPSLSLSPSPLELPIKSPLIAALPNVQNGTGGTYRLRKVVIDAGHGGKDTGCQGKNANEKDIALGIALKLGNYIKDLMPDVQVIYTRDKDFFVELHERAAIANRNSADLFISIHCNSAPKATEVHGTETYVMGLHKSRENLEVAMRENAVIALEADYKTNYDGFDPSDPQGNIIFSLYQNAYIEQSIKFASSLEKQFKYRANRASRGVKQEGFLVLYKTTMPAVLIETGFLSNSPEEKYLRLDEGQSLIASAIYRAFKEYKQSVESQ